MKYVLILSLISLLSFCAEEKETSTLVRPISPLTHRPSTPGAPKSHKRHLAIAIDPDLHVLPVVVIEPDLQPNKLKLKLAIVGCVAALGGAGLSATVAILSRKC